MYKRKAKWLVLSLSIVMLVSLLTACAQQPAVTPNQDPDPQPLVAAEVLTEAAKDLLNNLPDGNFILAADKALSLLEQNPDAILWVDMRTADVYSAGHIPGAVNIPYAQTAQFLEVLPTNKQIVFQCYSGQTSAQVTALANLLGFNAVSFAGGMNFGWAPLGLAEDTLETTENPLPAANTPDLDEREQIIWDAVVDYFSDTSLVTSPADLHALLEENPDAIMVLDIRSEADFANGHIEGAVNIPFKQVGASFDQLPTNRPIYITCYSGQTAGITLAALRVAGFNAFSVSRGMIGWNGAELPVVK
jgi:rhodanese-related sulfurtransferase